MNFATATFFLYLPIVFAIYWGVGSRRTQNRVLVAASYVFYGWWDYRFCALMLVSSLIDFLIGSMLGNAERQSRRRLLLAVSLAANLGLLGIFKYFDFFSENLQRMLGAIGWHFSDVTINIILPVGISFYTFQTLSYTIDVYRKQLKPTKSLIDYLAFVSFFPQLVAGPIERASNLLPQFEKERTFKQADACDGCRLILWGMFKKLAIADRLSIFANEQFADPNAANGSFLALATIFFAFQIYCDFSAYSDIAIGAGKLFDIRLMRNFNYPYFSKNLSEFWHRWHISLSIWFRDYVYIPLGGSRTTPARRCINIFVTFLVSGFWHGAAWRFLIWGGLHGAAVSVLSLAPATNDKPLSTSRWVLHWQNLVDVLKVLMTFCIVCLAWVFFRADCVGDALLIHQKIVYAIGDGTIFSASVHEIGQNRVLRTSVILLLAFVTMEWFGRHRECPLHLPNQPTAVRWTAYTLLMILTIEFVPQSGGQDFIYFEF